MYSISRLVSPILSHRPGLIGLRNMILGGVLLMVLLLGAASAAILWSTYRQDREEIDNRLVLATRLLEEHTLRNVQSVDLVLQIMVDSRPFRFQDHDPEYEG